MTDTDYLRNNSDDWHREQWLDFWRENQEENNGPNEEDWKDAFSLALGFYEPHADRGTVSFSAGVFIGEETVED